jgi:flagellar motility protein MotE (MotC chaperone)
LVILQELGRIAENIKVLKKMIKDVKESIIELREGFITIKIVFFDQKGVWKICRASKKEVNVFCSFLKKKGIKTRRQ